MQDGPDQPRRAGIGQDDVLELHLRGGSERGAEHRRSFDGQFLLVVDDDLLVIDPSEYHTLKDKIGALMLNRFFREGVSSGAE